MLDTWEFRSDLAWRDINRQAIRYILAELMYNELLVVDTDAFYLTIAWHNGADITP